MGPGPAGARDRGPACPRVRPQPDRFRWARNRQLCCAIRRQRRRPTQAPPLPEVAVTLPGDLWLLGPHRVLCGGCHQPGGRGAAAGRAQAVPDGHRSALRDRTGFRVARPGGAERLRAGRGQLHEAPDRGPHRNHDLRRHARRLVGSVRTGAQPRDRLRLARIQVHARGARRPAADRLPASPADHLEQGPDRPHPDALLVSARALLVRAEEERAVVREGRRELDDLGFAVPEVHHGRLRRRRSSIIRPRSRSS